MAQPPENQTRTQETSQLITVIHDQGGYSYCESCRTTIYLMDLKLTDENVFRCPNSRCDKILKFGETWINPGGSDF